MNATELVVAPDYIRVSAAKKQYFGGAMSIRWWYKQVESGRLPHFRAGGAVLLRPTDIEAFIAELYKERSTPVEPVAPAAVPVSTGTRSRRDGLRFFG
jgi:hypothetical protein